LQFLLITNGIEEGERGKKKRGTHFLYILAVDIKNLQQIELNFMNEYLKVLSFEID
jgi:hypothetical protein